MGRAWPASARMVQTCGSGSGSASALA